MASSKGPPLLVDADHAARYRFLRASFEKGAEEFDRLVLKAMGVNRSPPPLDGAVITKPLFYPSRIRVGPEPKKKESE